jgi:kynurenine formamidase
MEASLTARSRPGVDEVRGWLTSLSTWGVWGPDDDLGTLNYIGPAERAAAVRLATGEGSVSCALPITARPDPDPGAIPTPGAGPDPAASWLFPRRFSIQDGASAPRSATRFAASDAYLIAPHGPYITHLDAPRHTVLDGKVYNGAPAGASGPRGTIEAVSAGVVGRGVLLDVARAREIPWFDDGEAIFPEDLELAEAAAGTRVTRGDVLFVRMGYRKRLPNGPKARHSPRPGLQAACLPWLHERQVAVLASDVPIDVIPNEYEEIGLPIHTVGMWAMGLWLVDNCDLERLALACARLGRWEFLSVLSPLILTDGTGSAINPLAIF